MSENIKNNKIPESNSKKNQTESIFKKYSIDEIAGAIIISIMAIIAFINVLSRYLFHFSLAFTEEIEINMFVWVTVIGIGIAFDRGSHLGMVTVYKLFPKKLKIIATIFSALTSFLLILIVNIFAIKQIYQDLTLFHATTESLGISVSIYTAGIPLFSIMVFYRIITSTIKLIKKIKAE